jgi:hypothetical protein
MKNSKAFGTSEKVYVEGFEFKKLGSLKQFEIEWFDTESNNRLKSLLPIYELAAKVAKEFDIEDEIALALVQGVGDQDLYQQFLLKYSADLLNVKTQSYTETIFQRNVCTMIIKSRVSKKFLADNFEELNDCFDLDIDPSSPEWKDEYTGYLPLRTINEIIEFVTGERTEWVNDPKSEGEEKVDLGK